MKIRMLVNGDTTQVYSLKDGKTVLKALENTNLIVDTDTDTLVNPNEVKEEGAYSVYPKMTGG